MARRAERSELVNSEREAQRGQRRQRRDRSPNGILGQAPSPAEIELKGKQRRFLKSLANQMRPTAFAGKEGASSGLLAAIEAAFNTKELIKIKLEQNCPVDRQEMGPLLAGRTGSVLIQILGHTVLLYRPDPDEPVLQIPA